MSKQLFASIVLTSSVLAAQGEVKSPRPPMTQQTEKTAPLPDAPLPAAPAATPHGLPVPAKPRLEATAQAPAMPALRQPLYDQGADDSVWAVTDAYKAQFDGNGARFVPFFGADADRDHPAAFELTSVRVGGESLGLVHGKPERTGDRISSTRGGLREVYDVLPIGLEQMFVFDALPQRGTIELSIKVATDLLVERQGDGFAFVGPQGSFRYGEAVAIDAIGRRQAMASEWRSGTLVLTVPQQFVEQAQLPLTVDPVIGNISTVWQPVRRVAKTDVVFDHSLGEYLCIWEQVFSQTDSDIYAQRLDAAMAPVGFQYIIDSSTVSWRKCAVAGIDVYDRMLVVAEVSTGNVSPFWIGGRIFIDGASPSLLPQFDIEKAGVAGHFNGDAINPDVGGDPNPNGPDYFTVVWERVYSNSDHDIVLKQVQQDGTLRAVGATVVDANTTYEHHPQISKSDGALSLIDQRWAIVYRRQNPGSIFGHTRAALLSWDGQVQLTHGNSSFPLTPDTPSIDELAVSSMTDSLPHKFVLVTNEVTGANTTRLYGAAFDSGGNVIAASQDLGLNVVHPADPAIDSDGCRFAMSFTHEYNPQPLDTDLAAVTLAVVGNQILVQDLDVPGGSLELEAHGSICAVHSGGGGLNTYGVAWGYDSGANTFAVQARRYAGTGDGITSFRLTGCGGLNLSVTGIARLGDTIAFALTNAQGLAGFVAGAPISQPLGFCPGCTQGVSGSAVLGAQLSIPVPLNPAMVGSVIAFQGFDFGNGPCLGQIALSNTADVEVR